MVTLDLRHIYSYSDDFLLNANWTIKFEFMTTEKNEDKSTYTIYLGKSFPPPSGFNINEELPEFFSIMVSFSMT